MWNAMSTVPPILVLIVVDFCFLGSSAMEGSYRGILDAVMELLVSKEECGCNEEDVLGCKKILACQHYFCHRLQKYQYMSTNFLMMNII
jgi:hypothetical protein